MEEDISSTIARGRGAGAEYYVGAIPVDHLNHQPDQLTMNSRTCRISSFEGGISGFAIAVFLMIVTIVRHAHVCDVTSRNVTGLDII